MLNILIIIIALSFNSSCKKDNEHEDVIYRKEMRDFVIKISTYSKNIKSDFLIVPQNGIDLITNTGNDDGLVYINYLNAIDGNGQEDLFYGYDYDNKPTSADVTKHLSDLLDISKQHQNTILVTDYCSSETKIMDSYTKNNDKGYKSFAAPSRGLDSIPAFPLHIINENNDNITKLSEVNNFLYLINPYKFGSKQAFIDSVSKTNYDLLIIDAYYNDGTLYSQSEMNQLKHKAAGGSRLVIAYMSIGEAESYRYYWQSSWNTNPPEWLDEENPHWQGNFKVKYWTQEWQDIIYGNNDSYLKKILNSGFDGVYLDIIDAYEYYEK